MWIAFMEHASYKSAVITGILKSLSEIDDWVEFQICGGQEGKCKNCGGPLDLVAFNEPHEFMLIECEEIN